MPERRYTEFLKAKSEEMEITIKGTAKDHQKNQYIENLKTISIALSGMKYSDWCRIRHAIEQKYSSETANVMLGSPEEVLSKFKNGVFLAKKERSV